MKVTAVLNAAQGSMEDWNYVNTGPAYYQAVGMGMYGQANFFQTPQIANPLVLGLLSLFQIRKFL
jgi:hypothetical protein